MRAWWQGGDMETQVNGSVMTLYYQDQIRGENEISGDPEFETDF